jgi:hypothetical protein
VSTSEVFVCDKKVNFAKKIIFVIVTNNFLVMLEVECRSYRMSLKNSSGYQTQAGNIKHKLIYFSIQLSKNYFNLCTCAPIYSCAPDTFSTYKK